MLCSKALPLMPTDRRLVRALSAFLALALGACSEPVSPPPEPTGRVQQAQSMTIAPLTTGRTQFTATLLPNGKVLLAGGLGGNTGGSPIPLKSVELYDPATGNFTPSGCAMQSPRFQHSANLLKTGKVALVGGHRTSAITNKSVDLYDPISDTC